ncbi:MAG: hypothetical protein Q7R43_03325 [Candidatus Daviesbacteria bacterium]|nr:hypothetical protein [Candidatus Daviesbacteria bacterium]
MKKIVAILLTLAFLIIVPVVLAEGNVGTGTSFSIDPGGIPGAINPAVGIGVIINNVVKIVFAAASLLVLVFLIIGAFQWIVSGGDKEAVGKARQRITAALVGFAILALAFVILSVVGQILGTGSLLNFKFPSLTAQ